MVEHSDLLCPLPTSVGVAPLNTMATHMYNEGKRLEVERGRIFDMRYKLTAMIEKEGDGYVALCPELDIASQGNSVEEARKNLAEALSLFFECASPQEVKERLLQV